MDWMAEHWPWLAGVIGLLAKAIRDHIMIADHDRRIETLEDTMDHQKMLAAEQSADIKHIRASVDAIAERQGITEEDIKKILKSSWDK